MMEVEARSQLVARPRQLPFINQTDMPDERIAEDASIREIAKTLSTWVSRSRSQSSQSSMFDRGAYSPPDNPYDEMVSARTAIKHDDIVSGVADITESFAFGGVKWESEEVDEADIFNQINRDINMDELLRKMWRDVFTYSQYVAVARWGYRTYQVRGETEKGNKRKKKYRLWCPVEIKLVDPTKVVPVRAGSMGPDTLCWSANNNELNTFYRAYKGIEIDPLMLQFFLGRYQPTAIERDELANLGVDTTQLLMMNPELSWRYTLTKADYERFADVRLRSAFALLDLKRQLINSDRAMLIGAANYILLIRKGDPDKPATPNEMENLQKRYQFIARLPVIISDHRLQVDIVAPKTDFVLRGERYDVLDTRLLARLLGTLTFSSSGQRNETNLTLSKAVAKGMQNKRHMMARVLEERIGRAVVEHPRNAGQDLSGMIPSLVYTPRNISLDVDPSTITAIMGLRTQREMSRETILEYFGLDQATEAQRMEIEEEKYDEVFKTVVPYSANPQRDGNPNGGEPSNVSGARGGRPAGGGESPKNPTKPKPQTESGNPSTGD